VHGLHFERRQDVGRAKDAVERGGDFGVLALVDHRRAAAVAEVGVEHFLRRALGGDVGGQELLVGELCRIGLLEPVDGVVDRMLDVLDLPLRHLPRLRRPGLDPIEVGVALHAALGELRRVFAKLALGSLGRGGEGGEVDDGVGRNDLDHLAALPNGVLDKGSYVLGLQNHPHILL
jgi:hypothetical protein